MAQCTPTAIPATGGAEVKIVTNTTAPMLKLAKKPACILSKQAKARLKWFDYYEKHQHNASFTCHHFGISRQTFYRWKRRYNPKNLSSLEDHPCYPKRRRRRSWTLEQVEAVRQAREEYPRWGKDKLKAVLVRKRVHGRIRRRLSAKGN